jgi:hypothetical protein
MLGMTSCALLAVLAADVSVAYMNASLNVDPVNACPHGEKANALQRLCNGSSYGKRLLS